MFFHFKEMSNTETYKRDLSVLKYTYYVTMGIFSIISIALSSAAFARSGRSGPEGAQGIQGYF